MPQEKEQDAPEFSEIVSRFRKDQLEMSQSEFADQLDISPQTVSRWERGKTSPQKSQLRSLVQLADSVDAEEVIEDIAASSPTTDTKQVMAKTLGMAAGALGVAAAGPIAGAAVAAGKWFSSDDEKESASKARVKTIRAMLREAADDLDVSVEELRDAMLPPLQSAADGDWPAELVLQVLNSITNTEK